MKYLSNHERGVVISENKRDETDWKKGTSGKINLQSSPINGISRLAYNIGYEGGSYYMSNSSKLPNLYEEETKSETYTLKGFDFKNTSFPYPDNMIGPKFDDYPAEKSIYDNFIDELSRFINNGGLNNITSIKIQGTADAAAPLRAPRHRHRRAGRQPGPRRRGCSCTSPAPCPRGSRGCAGRAAPPAAGSRPSATGPGCGRRTVAGRA